MKKNFSNYKLKNKRILDDLIFIRSKCIGKRELLLYFQFSLRFSPNNIYKCLICDNYCVIKELKILKCQNKNHFYDHPFGVNFFINIPIFKINWSFQDEDGITDCLTKKGIGNLREASKWVNSRNLIEFEIQCKQIFETIHFNYYLFRGKFGFFYFKNKKNNIDISDLLKTWDLRVENLYNWTPQRGEFLSEYRDTFEEYLKRLDIRKRKKFILLLLLKYNKILYIIEIIKKYYKRQTYLFKRKFKKINNKIDLRGAFSRLLLPKEDFKSSIFSDYYKCLNKKEKTRIFFLKHRNIDNSSCKKFFSGIFRNKYKIRFKENILNRKYPLYIQKFFAFKKSKYLYSNLLTKKENFTCKLLGYKPVRYLKLKNFLFFLIYIKNCKKKSEYDILVSIDFRLVILFEFLIHTYQISLVKSKQKKF
jgi:hypothetical protein